MPERRFSPTIEETAACFVVRDHDARWMAALIVLRIICGDDGHVPAGFRIGDRKCRASPIVRSGDAASAAQNMSSILGKSACTSPSAVTHRSQ